MKKSSLFIFIFLSFIGRVSASTGTVVCTDGVYIRSSASTSASVVGGLVCNSTIEVLNTNAGSNDGCSKWYQIRQGNITGYSCGEFIKINNNELNVATSISDNIYMKENYDKKIDSDGWIACYEDMGDLSLRSTPGGISTGNKVSCGEKVNINSTIKGSGTCNYYYNVTDVKGNSGYVCSYFVNTMKLSSVANNYYNNTENLEAYYTTLINKGFPESYLPYLAEVHARHPNWIFNAEKINLDFNTAVKNESAHGSSLLEGSAFNQNYLSMGINNYNILTDTFSSYSTESGYYDASSEAVAYFMDPRNYLNEKYIFAFETLNFNSAHTASIINRILSSQSFWPSVYDGFEGNVYDDVVRASKDAGISAVHIASRIKQEISGISTSDMRLGGAFTYDGTEYSGYYNFFNIRVYGENKFVNGMVYAMNNGWDTPFNALYGGASFIADGYVKVNQDTMYYQKFDVSTSDGNYTHQYMQNVAAPFQETNTTYNSYINNLSEYLDTAIVFTIPVYDNMSNYAVISPSVGNPNNYLGDLKVDDGTVNNFSYDKFDYDVIVPAGTNSVNLSAVAINENAKVSGIGTINIDEDNTAVTIGVTSQSGRERKYTININRLNADDSEIVELSYILNNIGIKYNDNYMYGIKENTDINSLISNATKLNPYASIIVKDKNGSRKTSGIFKTGDTVIVSNSRNSRNLTVLIYGDINGDGLIDKLDYLAVLRHYYGYASLTGVYKEAADAKKDGVIDKLDYLAVLRDYYEYASIEQ